MQKAATVFIVAGLGLLAAAVPASAMTLEEVVDKHVSALGGREAWQGIRSMKITGQFTAFSKVHPFTMHRKRDAKYHMDHILDDKRVVIGYDGETAWWDNRWLQEGAQRITGPDLAVVARDVEFTTPLLDYQEKGHEAKLLGNVDFEGMETIGIELTRADESVETWYLDPKTYLPVGRISPGSDFGNPAEQRTYFDDYREVGGVMVPYLTESQWYTRDRVMEVENIEVNLDIDDALFAMPAPPGMGPLLAMAGTWDVEFAQRQQPGAPWEESKRTSTIEAVMRGAMLREQSTTAEGNEIVRTLSYDRFKKCYRLTQIDEASGQMDVEEGDFGDDGRLTVSNLETGTPAETFGFTLHRRISYFEIDERGFKLEYEVSIDGGENWFVAAKATYKAP